MLNTGGSVHNPIEIGGIFPFDVTVRISDLSWNYISADKKIKWSMAIAILHTMHETYEISALFLGRHIETYLKLP